MDFKMYKGKTENGQWVKGNLIYSKDVKDNFKAIIIPVEDNGLFTDREGKDLGFEVWYKVDIDTIELV